MGPTSIEAPVVEVEEGGDDQNIQGGPGRKVNSASVLTLY